MTHIYQSTQPRIITLCNIQLLHNARLSIFRYSFKNVLIMNNQEQWEVERE